MTYIRSNNIDDIYIYLVTKLFDDGNRVGDTLELVNTTFELTNPDKSFVTVRDTSIEYTLAELIWYYSGSNDVEFISSFGSIWKRLSDDGLTNNSAYGYIIKSKYGFDQLDLIVDMLTQDPTSRRAVININEAHKDAITTNDEPCTLTLQFLIRHGKLILITNMRSNDVWFGLPYDVMFFTSLQKYVAEKLGVRLGSYFHNSGSTHLYGRNALDLFKVQQRGIKLKGKMNIQLDNIMLDSMKIKDELMSLPKEDRKDSIIDICKKHGYTIEEVIK